MAIDKPRSRRQRRSNDVGRWTMFAAQGQQSSRCPEQQAAPGNRHHPARSNLQSAKKHVIQATQILDASPAELPTTCAMLCSVHPLPNLFGSDDAKAKMCILMPRIPHIKKTIWPCHPSITPPQVTDGQLRQVAVPSRFRGSSMRPCLQWPS